MIDPQKITNYTQDRRKLEDFLLFCILVAGKNAKVIAEKVNRFVLEEDKDRQGAFYPLQQALQKERLQSMLRQYKFSPYEQVYKCLFDLLRADPDLAAITPAELAKFFKIGPKTARFFVLHSRPNAMVAPLDVHALRLMRNLRYRNVPKATPGHPDVYAQWEATYIGCWKSGDYQRQGPSGEYATLAEFDLAVWNHFSKNGLKPKEVQQTAAA